MNQMIRILARSSPLLMAGLFFGLGMMVVAGDVSAVTHMDWQVISAAGGPQQSSAHKLFSVTGQPSPVGESVSAQYTLQSGFVPEYGGTGSCCALAGDANGDLTVNVGDAVFIVSYIFKGGEAPSCLAQGDPNCDATINVGDAVHLIMYLFKGGAEPCCL